MVPENRRYIDNFRSLVRDVISAGSLVALIGLIFYAGKLVDQLETLQKSFCDYKIEMNAKIITQNNDIETLKQWKVASTQKPFNTEK